MEYRFRAKKSWNIPYNVVRIIYLALIINFIFLEHSGRLLINISILFIGSIFLGFCFRELIQKNILTISDAGISYSGNDYIFAPNLENIPSDQLSKILIPNNEWLDLFERQSYKPTICLLDQQGKLISNLDGKQWQPLDNLTMEQALETCFKNKVGLANRAKILEVVNKHQKNKNELGKIAGYFAYASVGLLVICILFAFIDSNITIAWGQYEYLIWGIALITAVLCLAILVRAKTHRVALVFVPLFFTSFMTFFIHQSLMLLNYHLGQQKSYQFEKVFQTKDHEVWRTATGVEVKCVPSPRKLHDYETWIVRIGILGVVRTGFTEVCMLPQEIKQGKSA